ncbi:glutamyl-tRNA reductase [Flexistipes sinusarabici]|uniref:glutamyl-tRNA reductase n=1 Tax=Flexistipes sinusarabici TaxID=2352 RepID=UPI00235776F5|nr:glutamyl-tRNA reductase [Flexistipes sinusarabici]
MQLAVLGLNHNTAPVELREKLAVSEEKLPYFYAQILQNERIYEAMILSTCNRVEYYIVTDDFLCNVENVLQIISEENGVDYSELRKHTYIHCGDDAVRHIFRVASGLDSLVLGEPQIFGQVKDGFRLANIHGKMDKLLKKLDEFTIKTSKKVRTNTGISENPITVSYSAVELAKKIFGELKSKSALIIGAGEMCELAAKNLRNADISEIFVTNRTYSRAEKLAQEINGIPVDFERFTEYLKKTDIVISSTGAPYYVLEHDQVKDAMASRKYEPMFFIDIAVPRDIDPKINNIENTYVYDIDDLKSVVEANKKAREKEAVKAMEIVEQSVADFHKWVESLKIVPVIKEMRGMFEDIKEMELERFINKSKIEDEQTKKLLNNILNSYMNKVLHTPLTNLKNNGTSKNKYTLIEAVNIIFNLEEKK